MRKFLLTLVLMLNMERSMLSASEWCQHGRKLTQGTKLKMPMGAKRLEVLRQAPNKVASPSQAQMLMTCRTKNWKLHRQALNEGRILELLLRLKASKQTPSNSDLDKNSNHESPTPICAEGMIIILQRNTQTWKKAEGSGGRALRGRGGEIAVCLLPALPSEVTEGQWFLTFVSRAGSLSHRLPFLFSQLRGP